MLAHTCGRGLSSHLPQQYPSVGILTGGELVLLVMGVVGEGCWAGRDRVAIRKLPQGWVSGWRVAGDRVGGLSGMARGEKTV